MLEEAGRLLRLQMTNAWTPSTSCYDDQSSIPDLAEEPRFTEPLRQDHTSAQAEMEHEFGARDLPFRPSPARSTSQNDFLPAAPVSAVKAHIIHGDAYFMPVTLRFENQVTNSSIAINVPGRATATYPGPLTKDLKPGAGEKPFGPFVDKGSAEIGRLNEDLLGGEFVGC